VSVSRLNIVRNGLIAATIDVDPDRDLSADPLQTTLNLSLATDDTGAPRDSWFAVEAVGYRSMFPMVLPLEVPPLLLSDAVAALGSTLNLGGPDFGALRPPRTFGMTAYAHTNPVWVDLGGDGWTPPGVAPVAMRQAAGQDSGFSLPAGARLVAPDSTPPDGVRWVGTATPVHPARARPLFARDPANPYDVRRVLDAFRHGH
jgi:hypothetical protein